LQNANALIRTLVGDRSFRIKAVDISDSDEFAESGEPNHFHFFNIYSRRWAETNATSLPGVKSVEIRADEEYDPARLSEQAEQSDAPNGPRCIVAHIGAGATVKQEVRIGRGALVAMGAAVIEDVPDGSVVGGVAPEVIYPVANAVVPRMNGGS
jgi:hypothetical protein